MKQFQKLQLWADVSLVGGCECLRQGVGNMGGNVVCCWGPYGPMEASRAREKPKKIGSGVPGTPRLVGT